MTGVATEREFKIKRTSIRLPKVKVDQSSVLDAGMGLFVLEDIRKGSFVTEYGGPIIYFKEARSLQEDEKDTHLRSIIPLFSCYDGRVTSEYPLTWYVEHHLLGSFANDPYDTWYEANAKIKEFEVDHMTPAGQPSSKRVFYVATKDITTGSEIFFDYGPGYHRRHFNA